MPSSAIQPPTSMLAENANRIAILMIGTNDAESLIASLFASLYDSEASLTLLASLSSAVNDLIVVMPCRLLFKRAFKSATWDLTLEYLTPILL